MTKLKFINVFIIQWFFIRLTGHLKKDEYGNFTIFDRWSLQYWILPLTGWWSNFIYLNKNPKFLYLTKIKQKVIEKEDIISTEAIK